MLKIYKQKLTNTKKGAIMIRYSTQPSKGTQALTDSPTSPIITTKDVRGLNDNDNKEDKNSLQDYDADDQNGTD